MVWKHNCSHKKSGVKQEKAEEGGGGKPERKKQEICIEGKNYGFNNFLLHFVLKNSGKVEVISRKTLVKIVQHQEKDVLEHQGNIEGKKKKVG